MGTEEGAIIPIDLLVLVLLSVPYEVYDHESNKRNAFNHQTLQHAMSSSTCDVGSDFSTTSPYKPNPSHEVGTNCLVCHRNRGCADLYRN